MDTAEAAPPQQGRKGDPLHKRHIVCHAVSQTLPNPLPRRACPPPTGLQRGEVEGAVVGNGGGGAPRGRDFDTEWARVQMLCGNRPVAHVVECQVGICMTLNEV
jgi:hypothetical protein